MADKLRAAAEAAIGAMVRAAITGHSDALDGYAEALRAALDEPTCKQDLQVAEQDAEPVAWMYRHESEPPGDGRVTTLRWGFVTREWIETPLYTHPPRREWHGLTDEEIVKLIPQGDDWTYGVGLEEAGDFARAIEAKLKECNK